MSAARSSLETKTNPRGLLGLVLFPALALLLAGCGAVSVGDQSCTEDSKVNDKEDACPYGPPGGPKPKPGGCPNIVQNLDTNACMNASFDEIFPIFTTGPADCSNGGCHGESPGARGIYLPANDPNAFYDELKGYVGNEGYPYINDKEPAHSWILCNLSGIAGGGSPMPPQGMTGDDMMKVEAWAACGLRRTPIGDGGI